MFSLAPPSRKAMVARIMTVALAILCCNSSKMSLLLKLYSNYLVIRKVLFLKNIYLIAKHAQFLTNLSKSTILKSIKKENHSRHVLILAEMLKNYDEASLAK